MTDGKIMQKQATCHGYEMIELSNRDVLVIENGTPLPKGHGTLVERKEVLRKIYDLRHRTSIFSNNDTMDVLDELIRFVDFMPVIVGADKEGAEE